MENGTRKGLQARSLAVKKKTFPHPSPSAAFLSRKNNLTRRVRRRQTTGIKKRGLLLDLNCLPSQVARLIVRGFSRGRILLFARFPSLSVSVVSSLSLCFPLRSLLFFSFPRSLFPRGDLPSAFSQASFRYGLRSRTFRSRNNSAVPKFSLPSPPIGTRVVRS